MALLLAAPDRHRDRPLPQPACAAPRERRDRRRWSSCSRRSRACRSASGACSCSPRSMQPTIQPALHGVLGCIPLFGHALADDGLQHSSPPARCSRSWSSRSSPRSAASSSSACPRSSRRGPLALGATRWEMVRGVVLPPRRPGLAATLILGLSRALGEAIAVRQASAAGLVAISSNLFGNGDTLAARIANAFQSTTSNLEVASLFYLGGDPARARARDQPRRAADRPAHRTTAPAGCPSADGDRRRGGAPTRSGPSGNLPRRKRVDFAMRSSATAAAMLAVAVLIIVIASVVANGASRPEPRLLHEGAARRRARRRDPPRDRRHRADRRRSRPRSPCRSAS